MTPTTSSTAICELDNGMLCLRLTFEGVIGVTGDELHRCRDLETLSGLPPQVQTVIQKLVPADEPTIAVDLDSEQLRLWFLQCDSTDNELALYFLVDAGDDAERVKSLLLGDRRQLPIHWPPMLKVRSTLLHDTGLAFLDALARPA
jgi:hypothetical protein